MTRLQRIENILLFLTLLFLPTQLGKHFWPNFSYIYSLKVDYLSPTLYFWDVLVTGLLLAWIIKKPRINRTALSLFLIFLLTQLMSLLPSQNIGAGLVRLEQYLIAGLFGVYLASLDFKVLSNKVFVPLIFGVIAESVIAVLQFSTGSALGLWILGERAFNISTPGIAKFDYQGMQFLRPYGTFSHPNVLAAFILISICTLYQLLKERPKVSILTLFLSIITVFITMSRVAIVAGAVTLGFVMKKKWLIFTVIFFLIISPILFTRFSSLLNFDNLTLLRREELIESGWQIFSRNPILGVGLNNFIPEMANNLVVGPNRFLQPVHNIILLSLAETGLIGLSGFLLLVGYPVLKIIQGKIGVVKLLPWIMIFVLGMFDHYFLTLPQGYRLLFLVWGLSFSMLKCSNAAH